MSFTRRNKALTNGQLKLAQMLTRIPLNHRLRTVSIREFCSRNSSNICRSWVTLKSLIDNHRREASTLCSSSLKRGPSINQKCRFNRKLMSWARTLTHSLLSNRIIIEASTQKVRNHFIHRIASSWMRHLTQSGSHHAKISWCLTLRVILTLCPRTTSVWIKEMSLGFKHNRWALNTQKTIWARFFQLLINST